MKQRNIRANIKYYKNVLGTIKVLGHSTHQKVNVKELMGIENLRFEMRELSEHDKYKELI